MRGTRAGSPVRSLPDFSDAPCKASFGAAIRELERVVLHYAVREDLGTAMAPSSPKGRRRICGTARIYVHRMRYIGWESWYIGCGT
jgi:hypothetical protein